MYWIVPELFVMSDWEPFCDATLDAAFYKVGMGGG